MLEADDVLYQGVTDQNFTWSVVSSCLVVFSVFHVVSLSLMSNMCVLLPCTDFTIQLFNVFVVFLSAVSFILQ